MISWLPHVTHLLINELEARSLAGEPDPRRAVRALVGLLPPGGTAVVKLGACGNKECHVPAPTVRVIDTVGADDTFNAAYLQPRLAGQNLCTALQHGVQVASRAISTSPRSFVPAGRVAR
ncbi:carbohydrate kinase family protein [Deinococcus aestuarii]|uniref:carbohydrate kinase family protein n=1 Tax=Deinococcus aestuarii TaxID=2774531 RepID=UPI001FE3C7E9|nr:PfkB family carbohydrate kinase [Deinococcus aestuarii]